MRIGARYGNRLHAPEHSRAALLSAYTLGADLLFCKVQVSADGVPVLAASVDTDPATGVSSRVRDLSLDKLRRLDYSTSFRPRGSPGFRYRPAGRAPVRVEPLGDALDWLPPDVELVLAVDVDCVEPTLATLAAHGALRRPVLCAADPAVLRRIRELAPGCRTILSILDGHSGPVDADGVLAPLPIAVRADLVGLRLGALLIPDGEVFTPAEYALAARLPWAWGMLTESLFDVAPLVRPGRPWIATDFTGSDVDTRHFAFGYAKANRYCEVTQSDGVHVRIDDYRDPGRPVDERTEDLWYALRDWPFYSGGGFGLLPGVRGDFAAEVDFAADLATQATMCELAAVNVDPGTHRPGAPRSRREKDSFFDPHGAPPFVGVEHDEDDGYRINWNLGTEYDSNRYGSPSGDGSVLSGRFRLERRGPYFSAYYRNAVDATDWVCVGATRNDSMNRTVHLRCAGKRWRQEDGAGGFFPIVANSFRFGRFTVTRY